MQPLHEKHGSKRKADQSFDMSDQSTNAKIAAEYGKKVASGEVKILNGSEIDLGGGKYIRTFVVQE